MKILVSFSANKSDILTELKDAWDGGYTLALFNPALKYHADFFYSWNPSRSNSLIWTLDWTDSPLREIPPTEGIIFCTSGTTGRIKQVFLTKDACRFNQNSIYAHLKLDQTFTVVGLPPLFHAFGFNICLLHSFEKGLPFTAIDKFNPELVRNTLIKNKKVLLPLVPSMIDAFDFDPIPEIEGCSIVGGDVVHASHIMKLNKMFPKMKHTIGYGMTEAGPAITHTGFLDQSYDGLIGLPLPEVKAEIKEGILWFYSPGQATWIKDSDKNWEDIKDQPIPTGDIVSIKDGNLYFRSRQKDVIKRKAETIFPKEIENLIKKDLPFNISIQLKTREDNLILYVDDFASDEQIKLISQSASKLPAIYRPQVIEKITIIRNALGKMAS